MEKNNDNRYKTLYSVFSKEQVLAAALFFFRKLDDIDFSIIEDIIRRKMDFSYGKTLGERPLYESIEDLSDHISVSYREVDGKNPIYIYEAPIARGVARNIEGSTGYFCTLGEVFSEELYRTVENIYKNSLELALRKLSLEPELANINNSVEGKNLKPAKRNGLIKVKEYELSEDGIKTITDKEELEKILESINTYANSGVCNETLSVAACRGLVVKKSVTLTEKGRVYLLSKEYENQILDIRNMLYGIGCVCGYLEEYITHIYSQELQGFCSFTKRLNAIDYLKYCKKMGYSDLINEIGSDSKDHGAKVYPNP